jgi:hypothetical protein
LDQQSDCEASADPGAGALLRLVLNGFYNYYAVPTNHRALNSFYWHIMRHWRHCLRRRSQRHRLTWRKMMRVAERWLPSPKLRHPYPDWRFGVMTLAAHAGICAGGGEQSPSLPRRASDPGGCCLKNLGITAGL